MLYKKVYIRDGRAPIPISESISKVMSANKGKDTKPEIILRKYLWKSNLRGYRVHWNKVPGRPDIAYPGKKLAIFVNGCFWHRCPYCNLQLPKSNQSFWKHKFTKNIERDSRKVNELEVLGWTVLVVWECEINNSFDEIKNQIKGLLDKKKWNQ